MASIVEKRLSGRLRAYLVRFRTPDGQQRSKQFKRKKDAEAYVNLVEVDRLQGALVDPRLGRITVGEWWDQWWPTVTHLRASTRARDAQFFRTHVRPVFGRHPLGKLDRTAPRSWVAAPRFADGSNLAPATIHRVVQLLNQCVNAALEDRLIQHNPVAKLPLPKIERQEMRFLTSDELWHLADAIDPRYRAFVLARRIRWPPARRDAGLAVGPRRLLRRRVQVSETLVDIEGTHRLRATEDQGRLRSIPSPRSSAMNCRARPVHQCDPEALVFKSPEGLPDPTFAVPPPLLDASRATAGLTPLRIHDLRHTAVSLWIAEGANPKQVAALAGHTSVSVVLDRYGHLYPSQHDDLLERMERRSRPASG